MKEFPPPAGILRRGNFMWVSLPAAGRGAVWVLLSALLFSLMGILAKLLGGRIDAFQVAFFRAMLGFVFILPVVLRSGLRGLRTQQPLLHLWRGLIGGGAILCGFYALIHLPLADAAALSFTRGLFLAPLAAYFLGERIGWDCVLTLLAGMAGVLMMTSPQGDVQFAALIALLSAALVAYVVICVKQLSRTDTPATLIFYSSAIAAMVTAIPAFWVWTPPTFVEWILLGGMALLGVLAQNCFIRGYALAQAMVLAPLEYTRLLFAAAAGYIIFGDVPGGWAMGGAALIIGASLYVARAQSRIPPVPAPTSPLNG